MAVLPAGESPLMEKLKIQEPIQLATNRILRAETAPLAVPVFNVSLGTWEPEVVVTIAFK